jgi:hypothetical protein
MCRSGSEGHEQGLGTGLDALVFAYVTRDATRGCASKSLKVLIQQWLAVSSSQGCMPFILMH